jgi:hypothetical protein
LEPAAAGNIAAAMLRKSRAWRCLGPEGKSHFMGVYGVFYGILWVFDVI